MITLPIPSNEDKDYKYFDLSTKDVNRFFDIMKSLNRNIKIMGKVELTKNICCHLDPDLCDFSVVRKDGWRGSLGQINAAQKVL